MTDNDTEESVTRHLVASSVIMICPQSCRTTADTESDGGCTRRVSPDSLSHRLSFKLFTILYLRHRIQWRLHEEGVTRFLVASSIIQVIHNPLPLTPNPMAVARGGCHPIPCRIVYHSSCSQSFTSDTESNGGCGLPLFWFFSNATTVSKLHTSFCRFLPPVFNGGGNVP